MAFHKVERTYERPNFLDSEVGLVRKTREIPQSMGTDQDDRKIVVGGTPFPSNDANTTGLVFETIDVTDDEKRPGSVIVAGRIIEENLPVALAAAAKTALEKLGFIFV